MSHAPYISVVIVGRNDNYGDDFIGRVNTFMRSLDHQARHCNSLFELVIVEWNPPQDRAPLHEVLRPTRNISARTITVPPHIHKALDAKQAMLEYQAKNVGIRRARGEFVLVTNPDIVFSDCLIEELAKQRLRSDTVYRTDRCDFYTQGIHSISDGDLQQFAVSNTFVVHAMLDNASVSWPVPVAQRHLAALPRSRVLAGTWHTNGCGDFMLAARQSWWTVRGLYDSIEHRWHLDSISLLRFARARMHQQIFVSPCCVFHQHHERSAEDVAIAELPIWDLAAVPGPTSWGLQDTELTETALETA